MIYFTQPIDGGPIKIGHSGDVPKRIRQLETHYGVSLTVLATMEGGREEEQTIHAQFDHLRFDNRKRRRSRPEQFRPDAELMEFIGRPLLVTADPNAVEMMDCVGIVPIVNLRGSLRYAAWMDQVVKKSGLSKTEITRLAIRDWVTKNGFEEPPES